MNANRSVYLDVLAKEQRCAKSAGAPAERARGERTRAHPEAAERGRNVAEKVTAARAAAVVGDWTGDIHAHPMTAGFTQRIDALHGQAGQILHSFTSEAAKPSKSHGKESLTAARQDHWNPLTALLSAAVP